MLLLCLLFGKLYAGSYLRDIIEKPHHKPWDEAWGITGRYILLKSIVPYINAVLESREYEEKHLTYALREYAQKFILHGTMIKNRRYDYGRTDEYRRAINEISHRENNT